VLASLRAIFSRRTVKRSKTGGGVIISLEFPWEDDPIRRFGSVEEVIGRRTLDELVRMLAHERGGTGDSLPETYALSVCTGNAEKFDPADRQTPARNFLGDGAGSPEAATCHLRIQIVPICDLTRPEQAHGRRHSDLAPAAASTAPTVDGPLGPAVCESEDEGRPEQVQEQDHSDLAPLAASTAPTVDSPLGPAVNESKAVPKPEATTQSSTSASEVGKRPRGYLRKTDVLRAQLLPKIEALDFRGLFVGNFGLQLEAPITSPRVSLLSPTEANRHVMLANRHRRAGEHDQAAQCYRTLITHDPDNKDYWFLLGRVEEARADFGQAVHAYQNAHRLGHASARAEMDRIESEHGTVNAEPRGLLRLWRPTDPLAESPRGSR
jgi:hypothetical protein